MSKSLKIGELVQIWDHQADTYNMKMSGHGQVGYLVQRYGDSGKKTPDGWITTSGTIWEVICFGDDPPVKYKVHESWLSPINKFSDIKKVEDE